MSFEEDGNNVDNKHKADEGISNLQIVSTYLEFILFGANYSAIKIMKDLTTCSSSTSINH